MDYFSFLPSSESNDAPHASTGTPGAATSSDASGSRSIVPGPGPGPAPVMAPVGSMPFTFSYPPPTEHRISPNPTTARKRPLIELKEPLNPFMIIRQKCTKLGQRLRNQHKVSEVASIVWRRMDPREKTVYNMWSRMQTEQSEQAEEALRAMKESGEGLYPKEQKALQRRDMKIQRQEQLKLERARKRRQQARERAQKIMQQALEDEQKKQAKKTGTTGGKKGKGRAVAVQEDDDEQPKKRRRTTEQQPAAEASTSATSSRSSTSSATTLSMPSTPSSSGGLAMFPPPVYAPPTASTSASASTSAPNWPYAPESYVSGYNQVHVPAPYATQDYQYPYPPLLQQSWCPPPGYGHMDTFSRPDASAPPNLHHSHNQGLPVMVPGQGHMHAFGSQPAGDRRAAAYQLPSGPARGLRADVRPSLQAENNMPSWDQMVPDWELPLEVQELAAQFSQFGVNPHVHQGGQGVGNAPVQFEAGRAGLGPGPGPSTLAMQPQGTGFSDPALLVNNPFLDDVLGLNGSDEGDHSFVGAMGGMDNGGFAGTGYYDPQWGPAYPQGHYNF